jgi:hypothetical protein
MKRWVFDDTPSYQWPGWVRFMNIAYDADQMIIHTFEGRVTLRKGDTVVSDAAHFITIEPKAQND